MADGFLAPTGKFYPKTENFHAQTARAILGQERFLGLAYKISFTKVI